MCLLRNVTNSAKSTPTHTGHWMMPLGRILAYAPQLAAIAATAPVAKLKPCKEGCFIDLDNPPPITGETIELFTRPMPAQGVAELVEAFEHHIEQTRPIERSTIALSKYKGVK